MRQFSLIEKTMICLAICLAMIGLTINHLEIPIWKMVLEKRINVSYMVDKINREPVGKVLKIEKSGDLSRKKNDSYSYDFLDEGEDLFERDFLINGHRGKVTIELNSGEIFEMLPNSSIVLSSNEEFKMNTEVFRSAKIEVLSGLVEAEAPQIKIVEKIKFLPSETKIVEKIVEKKIEVPVEKIVEKIVEKPLELLSDLNLEDPLVSGEMGLVTNKSHKLFSKFYVDLKWGGDYRANNYEVWYSWNDKDYKKLANTTNSFYRSLEDQLVSGKIFFKVKAFKDSLLINTSKPKSAYFSFNSPDLAQPQDGYIFNKKVYLTWAKTSFTKEYDLEVSKDPNFSSSKVLTSAENFKEFKLPPGTYYWRVRSKNGNTISSYSQGRSFHVDNMTKAGK